MDARDADTASTRSDAPMIVLGVIAPHGDPAFVEGSPTQVAMGELGSRAARAAPDAILVVTPHNAHVEGSFAVVVSATIAGTLEERPEALSCAVDLELAGETLSCLREAGLPAVGVGFGSNDPALAVMPMDWGTLIPLWFLGARLEPPPPVVVVSPAREIPLSDHVRAGQALAVACADKRVILVASADHGHKHDPAGPFGFDPASADYDDRIVELVRENRLGGTLELETLADAAWADSLWQLVVLHGALGDGYEGELLSYERPTYFGMLCAAFEPRGVNVSAPERAPPAR